MAPTTKDKAIQITIASVLSLLAGGGGSAIVNHEVISRVTAAETRLNFYEKNTDKVMDKLADIEQKIEKGNEYIRDSVMPDITALKVDVATLNARR